MTTTLVLPSSVSDRLQELAELEVETGAILLVRLVRAPSGDIRLLGNELLEVPDASYERRERTGLLIASSGYVPALARAEERGAVAIWLHTHPGEGASPKPSRRDQVVDKQLQDLFGLRSGSDAYGAVVVAPDDGRLRFVGHLIDSSGRYEIDRLFSVGSRFSLSWSDRSGRAPDDSVALFDRNIRAFGGDVQRVLGDLRVAIVGCGGTGSAVAEQLVRLGVRHFLLVDPDELSDSNVTRVYGSDSSNIGQPKVEVARAHLERIAPDVAVQAVSSKTTVEQTARITAGVDIVFGCTDDNAGRLILSRLSTYMLIPVIDCGVLLTSDSTGQLDGIHGRVTVLHPGAACLVCRNRIDLARAATEMLTPEERIRRIDEGYAAALPGVEPAVVAYTTTVAAHAVAELLERLIGYGVDPPPSEILVRLHEREVSTNDQAPSARHYCDPASGKMGQGETEPFLEQAW